MGAQQNPVGLTAVLADTGTLGALLIFSRALKRPLVEHKVTSPCPQVAVTQTRWGHTPTSIIQNSREIEIKITRIKPK